MSIIDYDKLEIEEIILYKKSLSGLEFSSNLYPNYKIKSITSFINIQAFCRSIRFFKNYFS